VALRTLLHGKYDHPVKGGPWKASSGGKPLNNRLSARLRGSLGPRTPFRDIAEQPFNLRRGLRCVQRSITVAHPVFSMMSAKVKF
jgi:hypothetical protein